MINLCDEVSDCSENLRAIVEKVDPTHTTVVINKHDIVAMTGNSGGTKGTPNIARKNIKRCRRGDVITTRVRRLMIFV